MSGSQYIISYHEPNDFLNEDSFSECSQSGSGMYDYDEVHFLPMNFSNDTFYFQFDYQDPIETWLEDSFMERYPLHSILHILHYVNRMPNGLILPIFTHIVIQLQFLIFDTYIFVGWSYVDGCTRNMITLSNGVVSVVQEYEFISQSFLSISFVFI